MDPIEDNIWGPRELSKELLEVSKELLELLQSHGIGRDGGQGRRISL
jgi:hypothetical protein